VITLLALLATAHAADPCEAASDGFIDGPTQAWFTDGALGAPRRTCTRSELGVGAGGRITIDRPNFYGYVVGGLNLDGSVQIIPGVEVFGRLEAVRYDLAVASLSASAIGLGHLSVGAAFAESPVRDFTVGSHVKLVLPTATGLYHYGRPYGGELAVSTVWQAHPWVRLHDSFTVTVLAGSGVTAVPSIGGNVNLGLEFGPIPQFGIVADVDAGFLRTAPVDVVSVGGGLRFGDGKRFGFEVGARAPLAGRERANIVADLRGSVRFGPVAKP
jgi:hypothetical protein